MKIREIEKINKIQPKKARKKNLDLVRFEINVKKALDVPISNKERSAPKLASKKENTP